MKFVPCTIHGNITCYEKSMIYLPYEVVTHENNDTHETTNENIQYP